MIHDKNFDHFSKRKMAIDFGKASKNKGDIDYSVLKRQFSEDVIRFLDALCEIEAAIHSIRYHSNQEDFKSMAEQLDSELVKQQSMKIAVHASILNGLSNNIGTFLNVLKDEI